MAGESFGCSFPYDTFPKIGCLFRISPSEDTSIAVGEGAILELGAASVEGVEVRDGCLVPIRSSLTDHRRNGLTGTSLGKVDSRSSVLGEVEPVLDLQAQGDAREAGADEG